MIGQFVLTWFLVQQSLETILTFLYLQSKEEH